MTYELKLPPKASLLPEPPETSEEFYMTIYEDSVAAHLTKILNSDEHAVVISSAKILCETVKDFVAKVEKAYEKTLENAVAADAVASKVRGSPSGRAGFLLTTLTLYCFTAKLIK